MKMFFLFFLTAAFIAGCSGGGITPDKQAALIYLGGRDGNRIIFFNADKFPKLAIFRKRADDTSFTLVKTLSITPYSLTTRVGDNGPGYAYNWNDPEDNSTSTRYKVSVLDESLNILAELSGIYAVPDDNGDWVYVEK